MELGKRYRILVWTQPLYTIRVYSCRGIKHIVNDHTVKPETFRLYNFVFIYNVRNIIIIEIIIENLRLFS